MLPDYTSLCRRLGYQFKNIQLLESALSHRSVSSNNNERLEFLGDSILNFIVTDALYKRYPRMREGELSRLRASLVKGETLARIAHDILDIGGSLLLGSGELKTGGFRRESILADALEAIIAAIFIDADLATCQTCVLTWLHAEFEQVDTGGVSYKDSKTQLQELLQSQRLPLPSYVILRIEGEAHAQKFWIECKVEQLNLRAEASGHSKRKAEQLAAAMIVSMLEEMK